MSSPWAHKLPAGMTDLKLSFGEDDLPITHFNRFVYPEPWPNGSSLPGSFHRFMDLPLEIRLLVLRYCDTSTLFHLLHTCLFLRRESLKLFWEPEENLWYQSERGLETFMRPFYPIYDCPDFTSRITQIEIPISWFSWAIPMTNNYHKFWTRLQEKYPLVRKVILSGPRVGSQEIPPRADEYSATSELVKLAPPNLNVLVALLPRSNRLMQYNLSNTGPMQFSLWRVGTEPYWRLVKKIWNPMRVYLPFTKVSPGILRDLLSVERNEIAEGHERGGTTWLSIQTYAYYSNNPSEIDCPDTECHSKFPDLDQWMKHIVEYHNEFEHPEGYSIIKCHPNTPPKTRAVLRIRQSRADQSAALAKGIIANIRARFVEDDKFQNEKFNPIVVPQMKEYGFLQPDAKSVWESEFWDRYHPIYVPDCVYNGYFG